MIKDYYKASLLVSAFPDLDLLSFGNPNIFRIVLLICLDCPRPPLHVETRGGDKELISKLGLDSSCVVFIAPIKACLDL